MKIQDDKVAAYYKYRANNTKDFYSAGVITYAEAWAELIELKISEGKSLEEVAEETSHEADTEGITAYMYGCAVSILAEFWKYGELLRRWSNIKNQIGTEGEEANKNGGVLNPAIISIGKKE